MLTCSISKGFDSPVVQKSVTVENDLRDIFFESSLGNLGTHFLGGFRVPAVLEPCLYVTHNCRGGNYGGTRRVVDNLGIYMLRALEYVQSRTLSSAYDLFPHPDLALLPSHFPCV